MVGLFVLVFVTHVTAVAFLIGTSTWKSELVQGAGTR